MKKGVLIFGILAIMVVMIAVIVMDSKTEIIEHSYTFVGENDHWEANLQVDAKEIWTESDDGKLKQDNESNRLFYIRYKEDASDVSVESVTIAYNCVGVCGSSMTNEGPLEQEYTMPSSSKNGAFLRENSQIVVSVTLDGVCEEFYLTNEDNQ